MSILDWTSLEITCPPSESIDERVQADATNINQSNRCEQRMARAKTAMNDMLQPFLICCTKRIRLKLGPMMGLMVDLIMQLIRQLCRQLNRQLNCRECAFNK